MKRLFKITSIILMYTVFLLNIPCSFGQGLNLTSKATLSPSINIDSIKLQVLFEHFEQELYFLPKFINDEDEIDSQTEPITKYETLLGTMLLGGLLVMGFLMYKISPDETPLRPAPQYIEILQKNINHVRELTEDDINKLLKEAKKINPLKWESGWKLDKKQTEIRRILLKVNNNKVIKFRRDVSALFSGVVMILGMPIFAILEFIKRILERSAREKNKKGNENIENYKDEFINQDDAAWISFLLLFAQRGHFFSMKSRAIASLGILEDVPAFFRKQIKAVLFRAIKDRSEDVKAAAVDSMLKLIYKGEISKDECLESLLYVIENHHEYSRKNLQNSIFMLGQFNAFPEEYKDKIESLLVKLANEKYSQAQDIVLWASTELYEKGVLDFAADYEFLKKIDESNIKGINIQSMNSEFLTYPKYAGLNLSDSVVLELFEMFEKALNEKDVDKSMAESLAVVDSLLAQNKNALALGQKRISIGQDQKFLNTDIEIEASAMKNFYVPTEDKLEFLGRTLKITKNDSSIEAFKLQQADEDDDFFLMEATLMKNDERLQQRITDVQVLDISVVDIRELVDDQKFFEKLKIRNNRIKCIRYRPRENYFAYGEKEISQIPQEEREPFIKDFIDLGIEDIFYFLDSYGMAYIDILSMMHAPADLDDSVGRRFSLEALPVGDIDDFKEACEHSNLRVGGLADFSPVHAQIFYKEIDIFNLWFISRYQLFQILLKAANLAYKGRLNKEQMQSVFEFAYVKYISQLRQTMKLSPLSDDELLSDEILKYLQSMVDDLSFALEVCHNDNVFKLGEKDIKEEFDYHKMRGFIEIRNWRWYREDLGPYSCDFPAPALLNLVNSTVRDLLKEYSQEEDMVVSIVHPLDYDVILPQDSSNLKFNDLEMIETSI